MTALNTGSPSSTDDRASRRGRRAQSATVGCRASRRHWSCRAGARTSFGGCATRACSLGNEDRDDLYSATVEHVDGLLARGYAIRDLAHLRALLRQNLQWQLGKHLRAPAIRHETAASPERLDVMAPGDGDPAVGFEDRALDAVARDFLLELSDIERRVFRARHGKGHSQRRTSWRIRGWGQRGQRG